MSYRPNARSGYAAASAPIRTDRGTEYAVFAQTTSRLKALDETDKTEFPALAAAVTDNQRLWGVLFEDLMNDGNGLPDALRANLIGLAEFIRRHSCRFWPARPPSHPLIEINTSIMRGLRGNVKEEAA